MDVSTQLTHDALFYGSDDEFVAGVVPFLRDGLAQGHGAVAAVTSSNIALLREALDGDAKAVTLIDRDEWYRRPARTLAGWQRLLNEANARGQDYVRLVGEVAFGPLDRHPTWTRYESAINRVFAEAPAWIVCPYDSRSLPPAVLADARRTHPVVAAPARTDSDAYLAPEELLRRMNEPLPPVSGPPVLELEIHGNVAPVRHRVRDLLTAAGWSGDRITDALIVTSEIVANSICHGEKPRTLRVWGPYPALVCEVSDEGPGLADPFVGYRPSARSMYGGHGLWISHQLSDAMAIERRDGTTRVRFSLAAGQPAPLPNLDSVLPVPTMDATHLAMAHNNSGSNHSGRRNHGASR